MSAQLSDGRQSPIAAMIARGTMRHLRATGHACVLELSLPNGRRADIVSVSRDGEIWIIEIKSSVEDYRSDTKWPEYTAYCDQYFFAIPQEMNAAILPQDEGLIIADNYGAQILRNGQINKMAGARRRSMLLLFAHCAANRLTALIDPEFNLER